VAKGREAALKRAREKARQDKREAKREKKEARQATDSESGLPNEQALWEEFARLSASHEANEITNSQYETERQRILEALGIGSDT
jgi:hypothetical protein